MWINADMDTGMFLHATVLIHTKLKNATTTVASNLIKEINELCEYSDCLLNCFVGLIPIYLSAMGTILRCKNNFIKLTDFIFKTSVQLVHYFYSKVMECVLWIFVDILCNCVCSILRVMFAYFGRFKK